MNTQMSCAFALTAPLARELQTSQQARQAMCRFAQVSEIDKVMSTLSSDTHPKMESLQIELWRQASPTRKMNQLAQLNAAARLLALTGLRSQHPQASEAELRFKLASLLLGDELARKVYGEPEHAK
jgi:hypothetical protein